MVVAGEGWHPGVVGIVASRLVERWHRPCVVVALEGDSGRGSGRSTSAYDLHAGLAACSEHLTRFGGHRVAAGLELERGAFQSFAAALAAHAAAALSPEDLIAVEQVDAVASAGALGLDFVEELERLGPFGAGNPEPTLLVPAARVQAVTGMGEEREHSRFNLASAGGRARVVAFQATPAALARCAGEGPCDVAVRLERNRWNGVVEPRALLRALCPARSGTVRALGREEPFWTGVKRELQAEPSGGTPGRAVPGRETWDRRGEGVAVVAADLLTSGESVLVAVADVPRRLFALEEVVAAHAPAGLGVVKWGALAANPQLATPFEHVLALDPPPSRAFLPALPGKGFVELAWGEPESEFALGLWRAELDLRPVLADAWRALSALEEPSPAQLEAALRGNGTYARSAECCGRILRVLGELGLVEVSLDPPSCRILRGSAPSWSRQRPTARTGSAWRGSSASWEPSRPGWPF